jgi:hypothetical protein
LVTSCQRARQIVTSREHETHRHSGVFVACPVAVDRALNSLIGPEAQPLHVRERLAYPRDVARVADVGGDVPRAGAGPVGPGADVDSVDGFDCDLPRMGADGGGGAEGGCHEGGEEEQDGPAYGAVGVDWHLILCGVFQLLEF